MGGDILYNMTGYEERINYIDRDSWKKYIEEEILPLWRIAYILDEFRIELKGKFKDCSLRDVPEEDRSILLGGVNPDPKEATVYTKNSLAKFYKDFFGVELDSLQSWGSYGQSFEGKIRVKVADSTPFIDLVYNMHILCNKALKNQSFVEFDEPEVDYESLKKDPNKLQELVNDFLKLAINVSVNCNYHTFFLWSIKQLPYGYMKEAYQQIDQVMDLLEEFGLTEFNWENPFEGTTLKEDTTLEKDYTIWCWPEYKAVTESWESKSISVEKAKSFGGSICILNEIMWENLRKDSPLMKTISEYFRDPPNLKEDYIEMAKDRIREGEVYSKIFYSKKGIGIGLGDGYSSPTHYEEKSAKETLEKSGKSLKCLIDDISPYLFTGLAKITEVDSYRGEEGKPLSISMEVQNEIL